MPLDNYDLPPLRVACKRELEVVLWFFFGRSPRHHHPTSKTATTTILAPIHENSMAPQPPHHLYLSPLPFQHVNMRLPQYVHGQVTMIRGSRRVWRVSSSGKSFVYITNNFYTYSPPLHHVSTQRRQQKGSRRIWCFLSPCKYVFQSFFFFVAFRLDDEDNSKGLEIRCVSSPILFKRPGLKTCQMCLEHW